MLVDVMEELFSLASVAQTLPRPMGERVAREYGNDPFVLLIACLLSLRARDTAVYPVLCALMGEARSPADFLSLSKEYVQALLRPIGFYREKTRMIYEVCEALLNMYDGGVPRSKEKLALLPGVGPKTVAFMQAYAYGEPALCVDTHVHRLANRFLWVRSGTPEKTMELLCERIPSIHWHICHTTLVTWGQQVCGSRGVSRNYAALHARYCFCFRSNPI